MNDYIKLGLLAEGSKEISEENNGIMGNPYLSSGISVRARGCSSTEELTRVCLRSPSALDT